MDPRDLRYVGPRDAPEPDLHRRYRVRIGGQDVDAVVTESAATVWRQARPGTGEEDLDAWAAEAGGEAIRARLAEHPLDVSDVFLDHDLGQDAPERPRYGEGGVPQR